MIEHSLLTLLLVAVTVFFSYKGFHSESFVERNCFDVDGILVRKQYLRFISSGFLHTGWLHLVFNMLALLAFGGLLESITSGGTYLLLYFLGLVGGNALALLVHKNHSDYTSVGASGAISGLMYASIALFPDMPISFFFLPLSIPAWAFGLAYAIFTIYGIKARWGNTGHAAHLGGAVTGLLFAVALYPHVARYNAVPILLIALPTLAFIALIVRKPQSLVIDSFSARRKHYSIDHEYNYRKAKEQASVDGILEKIHRRGMKSLTKKERERLEAYAKAGRR